VSLVVAPWVLNRLGVKNAILVLPVFTLIGFTAVQSTLSSLPPFSFRRAQWLQTGLDDPTQNVLGGALPAQVVPKLRFLLNNAVLPALGCERGRPAAGSGRGAVSVRLLARSAGDWRLFHPGRLWVRSLYVDAIYARLRTHALSLADFQRAVGRPTPTRPRSFRGTFAGATAGRESSRRRRCQGVTRSLQRDAARAPGF